MVKMSGIYSYLVVHVVVCVKQSKHVPYGGKLWRGKHLVNQAKYHCWQFKIWQIVNKAHALFRLLIAVPGPEARPCRVPRLSVVWRPESATN